MASEGGAFETGVAKLAICPNCGMSAPHDGPCPGSMDTIAVAQPTLQGRYQIVSPLGQGGMGTVYIARDLRLAQRPCVVKKLRDEFFREEDRLKALSMFEREAHVLSQLQHPNIVAVLDYFEEDGGYFLVMEYVEGKDLSSMLKLRGQPFSEEQVIEWAAQICDVLDYLHGHEPPVIYRDLKPSNIMLDVKGRIKLVDFGIARPFDPSGEGTHVVSAGYSPPEQYWGDAHVYSDTFSLGATMHFLLTESDPLPLNVSSPQSVKPGISDGLNAIVQKATQQNAMDRYQTAVELKDDLLRLQRPSKKQFPEVKPPNRMVELIAVVAILLVTTLAFFAYQQLMQSMLNGKKDEGEVDVFRQTRNLQPINAASIGVAPGKQKTELTEAQKKLLKLEQPESKRQVPALQIDDEASLTDPDGLRSPTWR